MAEALIWVEMNHGMPTQSAATDDLIPPSQERAEPTNSERRSSARRTWRQVLGDWRSRPISRRLLWTWRVLQAPRAFTLRRRVARTALRRSEGQLHLDREQGFVRFGPQRIAGIEGLLENCRDVLDRARPRLSDMQASKSGQQQLAIELLSDSHLIRNQSFLDFALQDEVLLPVVDYLKTVPYLARVALPLSIHLPQLQSPAYFQRFHLDNDDTRMVKLFINAMDIEESDGPLCFLPADISARVVRSLRRGSRRGEAYWTFSDEEVYRHCDRSALVELTGPAGSGAFIDLARCLHFGSRVGVGRERPIFALTFLRYHRIHENASNHLAPGAGRDALRRLVLRPPVLHPLGTFFPDSTDT